MTDKYFTIYNNKTILYINTIFVSIIYKLCQVIISPIQSKSIKGVCFIFDQKGAFPAMITSLPKNDGKFEIFFFNNIIDI